MDKPLPKPLPAHTWTAAHLGKLKAAALDAGTDKAAALADGLPYAFPHVQEARYNADHKRVEVALHGGGIRFHVQVVAETVRGEKPEPTAAAEG